MGYLTAQRPVHEGRKLEYFHWCVMLPLKMGTIGQQNTEAAT